MVQTELGSFINTNEENRKEFILRLFNEGKTEKEIQNLLKLSKGKFYYLKIKLGIKNPKIEELRQKIQNRIHQREQGLSICEIAKEDNVTDQAVYYSIQRHASELLSKDFLSKIRQDKSLIKHRTKKTSRIFTNKDLPELLSLRKLGYSIGLQVTYNQRPADQKLWYIHIQRRKRNKTKGKTIGRVTREFIHLFYPEKVIKQKEHQYNPYLSLNKSLDEIIQRRGK